MLPAKHKSVIAVIGISLLILTVLAIYNNFARINAQSEDAIQFFSSDSKPYGISFQDWAAKWWQWIISIPTKDNPRLDPTGIKCELNQNEKNVWFLAQVNEGHVERHCVIPVGKSIFIPVLTGECDFLSESNAKSEEDLSECATSGIRGAIMQASINGKPIQEIEHIKTNLFSFTVPPDNIWSSTVPEFGPTRGVTDGYYVFIKYLSSGTYNIEFSANSIDNPMFGVANWSWSVKYILEIK
jgi:hypothetical protein